MYIFNKYASVYTNIFRVNDSVVMLRDFKSYFDTLNDLYQTYTDVSITQLKSIIYTDGKVGLYQKQRRNISENKIKKNKEGTHQEIKYTRVENLQKNIFKCKSSKCLTGKSNKCNLKTVIPDYNKIIQSKNNSDNDNDDYDDDDDDYYYHSDFDTEEHKNQLNLKQLREPFVVYTAYEDINIKHENLQYMQCKSSNQIRNILSYGKGILFKNEKDISNSPKIMVNYGLNKYQNILSVTRVFWVTFSVVCLFNIYLLFICYLFSIYLIVICYIEHRFN